MGVHVVTAATHDDLIADIHQAMELKTERHEFREQPGNSSVT